MQRSICKSSPFLLNCFANAVNVPKILVFRLVIGMALPLPSRLFWLFLGCSRKTILFTELLSLVIHHGPARYESLPLPRNFARKARMGRFETLGVSRSLKLVTSLARLRVKSD